MQKFDYRAPRFDVDLPVRVTAEGQTSTGRCKNISIEGMKLELRQPLPLDTRGVLSIDLDGDIFEASVVVTYAEFARHGVRFLYDSEDQRAALGRYLALLAAPQNRPGLILLD